MSNLEVAARLRAVQEMGQVFDPNDATSKKALYIAAQELVNSLEPPLEKAAKLGFYDVRKAPTSALSYMILSSTSRQLHMSCVSA